MKGITVDIHVRVLFVRIWLCALLGGRLGRHLECGLREFLGCCLWCFGFRGRSSFLWSSFRFLRESVGERIKSQVSYPPQPWPEPSLELQSQRHRHRRRSLRESRPY